tara:strand:+ start:199 stop:417 length:219 start_codon:yes stop_codon:yes gene_type:complete
MPNNKKNVLDKKKPYNLSIKASVIVLLEQTCIDLGVDKNTIAESLFLEFCLEKGIGFKDMLNKVGMNNNNKI